MASEIVIKNGLLLDRRSKNALCQPDRFIRIVNGRIAEIGSMNDLHQHADCVVIDANGCLVMPGLVNGHCHGAMTLFRGLADDLELMDWLENHIFPAEAQCVNSEMVYWCSKLAAAEMIRGGVTTVADGYFYESSAAHAFADSGMRAVAAQGVIDFPAPGVPDPSKKMEVVADFLDHWYGQKRIMPAIFAHSPYTCGPETLQEAKQLARTRGALFFIHLGETKQETDGIREKIGHSPVEYLQSLGVLDGQTVCIHCVWLDRDDIGILAQNEVKVVSCPESNMKLASGKAPLQELLAAGVVVCLGTDGAASNNNLNMFREMHSCMTLHQNALNSELSLSESQILEMATLGGANVLGLGDQIGSLETGKKADIVLVDYSRCWNTGFPVEHNLVHSISSAEVQTVIVDGEVIMLDRKITSFDEYEAMAHVRQLAKQVRI